MSSPKPDAARRRPGAAHLSDATVPAFIFGRLAPLALDRARRDCDVMTG